jgi:hypothetical protein
MDWVGVGPTTSASFYSILAQPGADEKIHYVSLLIVEETVTVV